MKMTELIFQSFFKMVPFNTPSKRAGTSKANELVPPSPRSLASMYDYAKSQHDKLKAEMKEFMKRLLVHWKVEHLNDVILEEDPLHKTYDFFLDAVNEKKIPVVVLSDSSNQNEGNSYEVWL